MEQPKNILLTGITGYIGKQLLPLLAQEDRQIFCLVRDKKSVFLEEAIKKRITLIEADLLEPKTLEAIPKNIEGAYYLVHSMAKGLSNFRQLDKRAAENFAEYIQKTSCKQTIYLSGLISDEKLSEHLSSRREVEELLKKSNCPVTTLRAGIIIGSGSASFKIICDLVEKLPIMVAPKWVKSRSQPIAIEDALFYLLAVLGHKECIGKTFDIGGPDILTYKEILLEVAKSRGLHRWIVVVPILTPTLSSYWLYFITSANYHLARSLIDSLKNDAICTNSQIHNIFPRQCLSFKEAVKKAQK